MSISRKVIESLDELGFGLSAKPTEGIPELPRDITELDDEGLMDLFVQFTQWNDHLAGVQAVAIINERESQRNLDNYESTSLLKKWTGTKGETITFVKAQIAASDEMQALAIDLDTKYAFRKLIEIRTDGVEKNSRVVSRELTRRTSDGGGMRARTRRFTT